MSTLNDIAGTGVAQSATRNGRTLPKNAGVHAGFVAALCCLAVGYAGSYVSLVDIWAHSGTFEYAFLIFPICAVLAWSRRQALARVQALPRPRALWLAAGLALFWLMGALASVNLVEHFAIVAFLPVLVYAFYGPLVAGVLAFPLGYVFFAVPFGNFMVGPLQDVTAQLSVWLMQFTSIPVFKSGRIIQTPAAAWHVAEACSGVKFFVATTAFGVLYANLFFSGTRRRLIFVACAMVVPIIANALRVFFTILIGEYFGVQYATGTDHMIFGWQFFGTVLVVLFFAGWPFHEPPRDLLAGRDLDARPPVARRRVVAVTLVAVLVLASAPAWLYASRVAAAAGAPALDMALPTTLAGRSPAAAAAAPQPGARFADPSAHARAFYALPQGAARVERVAYRGLPGKSHELITVKNRLYDPGRWQVVARSHVAAAHGVPAHVRLRLVSKAGAASIEMRYATRVGSHWQTSDIWLKAWQVGYGLVGRAAPTELIAVSEPARAPGDRAGARAFGDAALAYAAGGSGDAPR